MSSVATGYKKYTTETIFKHHPEFFSHFLIKQEEGESFTHFKKRYIDTCVEAEDYNWSCFRNIASAKAIFFLVGLRNRWLAREVYAICCHYGPYEPTHDIYSVIRLCNKVLGLIHLVQQAKLISRGRLTTYRRSTGIWNWMQYTPGNFPQKLEKLRYILVNGKEYVGQNPPPQKFPRRLRERLANQELA